MNCPETYEQRVRRIYPTPESATSFSARLFVLLKRSCQVWSWPTFGTPLSAEHRRTFWYCRFPVRVESIARARRVQKTVWILSQTRSSLISLSRVITSISFPRASRRLSTFGWPGAVITLTANGSSSECRRTHSLKVFDLPNSLKYCSKKTACQNSSY